MAQINQAMVLAAGLGTRMRPLTNERPKPLIPCGGKPLLDWNLDALAQAGVARAVVNVHYLPDQIITHVARRAHPACQISDERDGILDSGGGIARVVESFGAAPFFSLNADTIWLDGPRSNLERMAEHFNPDTMDVLLLLASSVTTIGWGNRGDFFLAQDGRIRRPTRSEVAPFAYTGAAILKPSLFRNRPAIFSLNQIFNEAQEAGRLHGLRLDGVFMHVGTPEALAEAENALKIHVTPA
jgi:MurNAc alpha-1-phosphate uridylyltransferase